MRKFSSLLLMAMYVGGSVQAASKSATLGIRLAVEQACEAGGATSNRAVSFGTLDMGSVPTLRNQVQVTGVVAGAGAIRVKCAPGTSYKVFLGQGLHSAGGQRKMAGPQGELVDYALYQDGGHSRPWDETKAVSGLGTGQDTLLPVYAVVKPQRTPVAGMYRDTVRVLVEW